MQDNCHAYPMLARIALDILPIQASLVSCECLFSSSKLTAIDQHSWLGSEKFEQLQVLKNAWHGSIVDLMAWNSDEIEEVTVQETREYEDLLQIDKENTELDNNLFYLND